MFKVGQRVVGKLAPGLRDGETHPSIKVGQIYTIRKLMADGRVIVDGFEFGVSARRFRDASADENA